MALIPFILIPTVASGLYECMKDETYQEQTATLYWCCCCCCCCYKMSLWLLLHWCWGCWSGQTVLLWRLSWSFIPPRPSQCARPLRHCNNYEATSLDLLHSHRIATPEFYNFTQNQSPTKQPKTHIKNQLLKMSYLLEQCPPNWSIESLKAIYFREVALFMIMK